MSPQTIHLTSISGCFRDVKLKYIIQQKSYKMGTFLYTARRKTGERVSGSITAENRRSAIHKIEQMNLVPVSLQGGENISNTENSNLTFCPACSKMVSKAAFQCPQCGHPLQEKSYLTKDLGFGGMIYSLTIGIGLIMFIIDSGRWTGLIMMIIGCVFLAARMRMWSGAAPK